MKKNDELLGQVFFVTKRTILNYIGGVCCLSNFFICTMEKKLRRGETERERQTDRQRQR